MLAPLLLRRVMWAGAPVNAVGRELSSTPPLSTQPLHLCKGLKEKPAEWQTMREREIESGCWSGVVPANQTEESEVRFANFRGRSRELVPEPPFACRSYTRPLKKGTSSQRVLAPHLLRFGLPELPLSWACWRWSAAVEQPAQEWHTCLLSENAHARLGIADAGSICAKCLDSPKCISSPKNAILDRQENGPKSPSKCPKRPVWDMIVEFFFQPFNWLLWRFFWGPKMAFFRL